MTAHTPTRRPHRRPPLPRPLASPLSRIYRAILTRRNRAFNRGTNVTRLPIPVISVGNLSVGGTGKTPMVRCITQWLTDAGAKPAIAMRGYKSHPSSKSDEQLEHADAFPSVPIIAQPDRLAGLQPLIEERCIDCAILDDGFQHRTIARDLDIVLLDATRNVFADRCLPAGWLREPVTSLSRAHIVILTHCESAHPQSIAEQRKKLTDLLNNRPILEAHHHWDHLITRTGTLPVESLTAKPVMIACGIGNPTAFINQARAAGANIKSQLIRRDHHNWHRTDVRALHKLSQSSSCATHRPAILTTGKDWHKLEPLLPPDVNLLMPALSLKCVPEESTLKDRVLQTCRSKASAHSHDTIEARG